MGLEDDFLLADADDEKTIEFIKNYLPQELKEKFSDDELYYFLDLIDEYYSESGILDAQPDEDGYVNIDLEEVVAYIVKEAKKDEVGVILKKSSLWFRERWNTETLWDKWTKTTSGLIVDKIKKRGVLCCEYAPFLCWLFLKHSYAYEKKFSLR